MPATEIQPRYLLRLTAPEYRLVTLALVSKLVNSDDVEAAKQLNLKLCNQRVAVLADMAKAAQNAASQAEMIANPGGILSPTYGRSEPSERSEPPESQE